MTNDIEAAARALLDAMDRSACPTDFVVAKRKDALRAALGAETTTPPPATGEAQWPEIRDSGGRTDFALTPATGEAWPYECPRCGDRFKTDPRDMKHGDPGHLRSGLYCPGPVSATGEAGTRGAEKARDAVIEAAKAWECDMGTMGSDKALSRAVNAMLAAEARALSASRDASNPGEKEAR